MLSRREFLRNSALVASGVIALGQLELLDRLAPRSLFAAWPTPPKLWGDGIHDDTAALQWLIDEASRSGTFSLPYGTYRITSTIEIAGANGVVFDWRGAQLIGDYRTWDTPMLSVASSCENCCISNGHFIGQVWDPPLHKTPLIASNV